MRLSIAYNGAKNGIELLFSEEPVKELALFLRELGFKGSLSNPKMWYVANHPAYSYFTKSLKEVLDKGDDWKTVDIQPSFAPSLENIDNDKFSLVTIHYRGEEKAETQNYVLFDSYKRVASEIATRFAMKTYGDNFKHLEVFPRNYKRKARSLFKEGKIISETPSLTNSGVQKKLPLKEEAPKPENEKTETPKQEVQYKIAPKWVKLDDEMLSDFQNLINTYPEKLHIKYLPSKEKETDVKKLKILRLEITSDRDTISFLNDDEEQTISIVSFIPFDEGVNYGAGAIPVGKLKKAIKYIIAHPEKLIAKPYEIVSYATDDREEKQEQEEIKIPETTEIDNSIHKEEETEISKLRETLNEVIGELLTLEETSEGESENIIGTMLFDLEEAAEEQNDIRFKNQLLKSIQLFKGWVVDLDASLRLIAIASMSKLTQLLDGTSIPEEKQKVDENKTPKTTKLEELIVKEEKIEISKLRETLNEVIGELLTLEEILEGESETIISTTRFDLEDAADEQNDIHFKNQLLRSIQLFKDWVDDLDASSRLIAIASMRKLTQLLDGEIISITASSKSINAVSKDIFSRDHIVQNVLVPSQAGEPFQSGGLYVNERNFLKFKFPQLYKINDNNLNEVSGLALFQLSQMAHPKDYGIDVNRSTLLQEWESRGREAFKEIGFPTDLNYPYVNIHTGYKSISPLGAEVQAHEDKHKWWAVVEHARPIADPAKGIAIIDELLMEFVEKRLEIINPKTGKPKTDKKSKEVFSNIDWEIQRLETSKQVILDYLNSSDTSEEPKETKKSKTKKNKSGKKTHKDYVDRVIAVMHTAYAESKRLSKSKIEALKEETGTPNLGMLWEAVELSWLLWYKMIYREPIPFEDRLHKMEQFWNNVQPTYAYSDSSKELYKQYSTPCPIGAIIAEYTQMKTADFIFEPSAGNGLLVMGANPRITHVNEIDTNRKHSLEYQKFGRITTENAAEPFPELLHKVHDVVVTNPPFAKWEASKFDKERIAKKYFHNHLGVANNIRLEHLMSGYALYTMTDHGRAAIIIMGHIYFGEDGLLAKYRPFFNWLYRHYIVDDVINMNSYKLYNRQGAVTKTMLILIGGRKTQSGGVAPTQEQAPYLEIMVETFPELWKRVKTHIKPTINTLIQQLKIAKT